MYPWFDAPAAGEPLRYDGWIWDPAVKDWIPDDVEEISFEVEVPGYPMPTRPPRPAQPLFVEGWYWNGRRGVWEETTMPFEDVLVIPERPPMPTEWPSRTQPAEVPGWRYSFMYEVWEKIPMESYTEMREQERGPMPEYVPGTEQPSEVQGWSWSGTKEEWVATIVVGQRIGFTPPRSFPPGFELAQVTMVYPMTEQHALFVKNLLDMGLTETEAKRIGSAMVDGFWNMARTSEQKIRAAQYADSLTIPASQISDKIEAIGVYGAVIALAAIVGLLIGSIMDRILTPDEDFFRLTGGITTYLLGPGNWAYSRHIGTSPQGRKYYSECHGIGTGYTRHKRGYGIGQRDIIDFPGGFVESGFQFPYFVKYTWEYWELEYVGMLASVGADYYVLKVGRYFTGEIVGTAEMISQDEWCDGFRFYL